MLSKISEIVKDLLGFAKTNLNNIILMVVIILFLLLAFASGYIVAKSQDREPIQIQSN